MILLSAIIAVLGVVFFGYFVLTVIGLAIDGIIKSIEQRKKYKKYEEKHENDKINLLYHTDESNEYIKNNKLTINNR